MIMKLSTHVLQIVYDFGVLVLIIFNTLGKPRRRDIDIIKTLYMDGFLIFLARNCYIRS